MRRVGWSLLAAFGVAGAPQLALAQEPPQTYALSWVRAEGAEDCPTGRALALDVERRLGRKVFDVTAERSFEVDVTRFGARYHSDVYVRDASGRAVGHRTLESDEPSCQALFDATALAIALVIDPEAASRPTPAAAAFEAPAPAPAVPPAPAAPPAPVFVVPPPPPRAPQRRTTDVWLAPRGMIAGGLVPGAAPALGLAMLVQPRGRWGFSAVASYTLPRTVQQGIGDFEISLTRLTLALTLDALHSAGVRLLLSAGPSLGAFHVAVREPVPVTNPGDFLFAAWELGALLQISVTSHVFVDLGSQALVPLRREEFLALGQTEPVWRQPWLAGVGFLGVGARFP
jgi:hypothetical protein